MKNKYIVVVENSSHANWTSAQANCEAFTGRKKKAYVVYRDVIVTEDVKKNMKKRAEGI